MTEAEPVYRPRLGERVRIKKHPEVPFSSHGRRGCVSYVADGPVAPLVNVQLDGGGIALVRGYALEPEVLH